MVWPIMELVTRQQKTKRQPKNFYGNPSFLVAPPWLKNSLFDEAVILHIKQRNKENMGFIINRPLDISISDLTMDSFDAFDHLYKKFIYFGGPVSKNAGFVLYEHEKNKPLAEGIFVTRTLSISPAKKVLDHIYQNTMPGKFELILGYCSWKSGQLERELSLGQWLNLPFNRKLVFNTRAENRWMQCFNNYGASPLSFTYVPGGARA